MKTLTPAPTGYAIREIDLHDADERLLDAVVAQQHAFDSEAVPEDPPMPDEAIKARLRGRSQFGDRRDWLAYKGEELVGRAVAFQNKSGSNEHLRDVGVYVRPEHRGRGLGRALFAQAIASMPDDGSVKLINGWTTTRVPSGAGFAEAVGAKKGLRMRVSQVDLRTIDRTMIREWASVDPKGYRLELVDADIPDHLMAPMINALNAINRMPREDLEMEDWKFTPETMRDWERQRKERGQVSWTLLAIHEETGEGIAFTGVQFDPRIPTVIHQGGTAVDTRHQGKDLGKWLKAKMVEKILTDMPEARFIRTDNAGTNKPMLAINDRMGFKEAWWGEIWQLPLEDARTYAQK